MGIAVLLNAGALCVLVVLLGCPGHDMGHYKAKCSLCSAQQLWWSLHWALRPGWAGDLWGLRFC